MIARRDLLLLGAAAPWPLAARAEPQRQPWPRGRALPALSLPDLDGGTWTLAGQRGRVVALNFWASWCAPCRAEMPSLELLAGRHEADGLTVVAVNFKEGEAAARRFAAGVGMTVPILRDADGAAARALGVRILPSTVFVGRDGAARFLVIGEADWMAAPARQWAAELL